MRLITAAAVLGLLSLSGCGTATSPYAVPTPSPSPGTVVVRTNDSGRTYDLELGQRLRVELSPATTGVWTDPRARAAAGGTGDVGLFREGTFVDATGATADFVATAVSSNTVEAQGDVECAHTATPCPFAASSFVIYVTVHAASPSPTPSADATPVVGSGSASPGVVASPTDGGSPTPRPSPSWEGSTLVLTNADNGGTVTVTTGQRVRVELDQELGHYEAPETQQLGLFRESVEVSSRTTALFKAVAATSTYISSYTDLACLHSNPACLPAQRDFRVTVEVREPTGATSASLSVDVAAITAGNAPRLSGVVRDSTGQPVPSASVTLLAKEYGASSYVDVVGLRTADDGTFSVSVRPLRQTAFVARATGVSSPSVVVFVTTRVQLDSPPPGAASSPVTFAGSLIPAHAGVAVGLATLQGGRFVVLAQTRTDASGRFTITRALSRGSATYVVFTSAHSGNRPGSRSVRLDVG